MNLLTPSTTNLTNDLMGSNMALPIWALYMRSCYEDESLKVSKEDFEEPTNLSIEVDCDKYRKDNKEEIEGNIDTPEIDF